MSQIINRIALSATRNKFNTVYNKIPVLCFTPDKKDDHCVGDECKIDEVNPGPLKVPGPLGKQEQAAEMEYFHKKDRERLKRLKKRKGFKNRNKRDETDEK